MTNPKINRISQSATTADVCIVLHAHAPYVRQAGRTSDGEQDLHGLISASYIPLLKGVLDLLKEAVPMRVGLAISPILLEQLADPVVQRHTLQSLDDAVAHAEERVVQAQRHNDDHAAYIAQFYVQVHRRTLNVFEKQWQKNLIKPIRDLVEAGVIELLAHTATHVVPQLHDQRELRLQLETGILTLMRYFGRKPNVLWSADDPLSPDLLDLLKELDIHSIVGVSDPRHQLPPTSWLDAHQNICLIAPQRSLDLHVQSVVLGYPSDMIYRQPSTAPFHDTFLNRAGTAYDPYHAYARAGKHAEHFVEILHDYSKLQPNANPLIVTIPMEVLGAGWFEGGVWMRRVVELLAGSSLRTVYPSELREYHPPQQQIPIWTESVLRDGSLTEAAKVVRATLKRYPRAYGDQEDVLNQLVRELLLAQSGDWDRWQHTPAAAYAQQRRAQHVANIATLLHYVDQEVLLPQAREIVAQMSEQNNPFPTLNYRSFGEDYARV